MAFKLSWMVYMAGICSSSGDSQGAQNVPSHEQDPATNEIPIVSLPIPEEGEVCVINCDNKFEAFAKALGVYKEIESPHGTVVINPGWKNGIHVLIEDRTSTKKKIVHIQNITWAIEEEKTSVVMQ